MTPNSLAESLYERLLRSFPADQAYTPADWTTEAMPDPVRHYLEHLLRHHSRREARRLRRARTDWVDYDHPEMEQAVRSFFATVENHTQVPRDQWADTLRTATHRTTAYLVRPISTLVSFVFDGNADSVSASQAQWQMRFFGPYSYLSGAVQALAEKGDRERFGADAFERTLRRVDERTTGDFDAGQWIRLLAPLYQTVEHATGDNAVPLPLLHTFFEEKNASRIVERLTTYEQEEDADAVAPDTLRHLIQTASQTFPPEHGDVPEPPSSSAASPAPQDEEADSTPSPDRDDRPATADDERGSAGPTPLWKQFQQGRPRQTEDPPENTEDDPEPLWARFQRGQSASTVGTEADGPSVPPSSQSPGASSAEDEASADGNDELAALEREVLGAGPSSHRTVYVQELFQGDEDAYRQVLKRLRTTDSWSEASQIIASDVFRPYQVNIYSDAAVHFTNAVEASFQE